VKPQANQERAGFHACTYVLIETCTIRVEVLPHGRARMVAGAVWKILEANREPSKPLIVDSDSAYWKRSIRVRWLRMEIRTHASALASWLLTGAREPP
jgi:hypothetical protein